MSPELREMIGMAAGGAAGVSLTFILYPDISPRASFAFFALVMFAMVVLEYRAEDEP